MIMLQHITKGFFREKRDILEEERINMRPYLVADKIADHAAENGGYGGVESKAPGFCDRSQTESYQEGIWRDREERTLSQSEKKENQGAVGSVSPVKDPVIKFSE